MRQDRSKDKAGHVGVLVGERGQKMSVMSVVDKRQMHGHDPEHQAACDQQIEEEPAIQQKKVHQEDAEPDDGKKDSQIDPNQKGSSKQDTSTKTKKSLPLTGQEKGDREQVGDHQKRDVGFEILAVDQNHQQTLEKGEPERSVQSSKEKEGNESRASGNGIKISSHDEQMGPENPEERADGIKPEYIVPGRDVSEGMFAAHKALADQGDISFVSEVQTITKNQAIVEDREQEQCGGGDEAISSSIQGIHLKIWNLLLGQKPALFDFWVK